MSIGRADTDSQDQPQSPILKLRHLYSLYDV